MRERLNSIRPLRSEGIKLSKVISKVDLKEVLTDVQMSLCIYLYKQLSWVRNLPCSEFESTSSTRMEGLRQHCYS